MATSRIRGSFFFNLKLDVQKQVFNNRKVYSDMSVYIFIYQGNVHNQHPFFLGELRSLTSEILRSLTWASTLSYWAV